MFGAPHHSTCLRLASARSCPYTAPSSRIPRQSSRMRFAIVGTTWTCTRFHPFLSSVGCGQGQRDSQSLHDAGRPSLAGEGVVRKPPPSADPTTSRTALIRLAVAAAPLQLLPPRRPCAEPSCVVTLQRPLRKSGFSRGSALKVSC